MENVGLAAQGRIDPYIAEAICRLETGHGTSRAFKELNNFGGMMGSKGLMSFTTKEEGLEAYIEMLEWYYEDGLDTIEKIASRYCPHNQEAWISSVQAVYNECVAGTYTEN